MRRPGALDGHPERLVQIRIGEQGIRGKPYQCAVACRERVVTSAQKRSLPRESPQRWDYRLVDTEKAYDRVEKSPSAAHRR